jgi:murein L,D-transpeptidase YafK
VPVNCSRAIRRYSAPGRSALRKSKATGTPEGNYVIDARNPKNAFHLSLRVSYPDACDQARAAIEGVSPGGDIYIHGRPDDGASTGAEVDWTQGCIAVSDVEIREIWSLVPTGARIVIHP